MMMRIGFLIVLLFAALSLQAQSRWHTSEGNILFLSDAPLELISAESSMLRGVIDPTRNAFAFSVAIRSFEGFNSPLQREHFNENYLESNSYPTSTFSGKIIEPVDFSKLGQYTFRAKGKLVIHGVERERIIRVKAVREKDQLTIEADFTVLLAEHDISIPKIVHQKIAEEIAVKVKAIFAYTRA